MTPEDLKSRHAQSLVDYPDIQVTESEYVLAEVHRHPIGLAGPFISCGFFIILVIAFMASYSTIANALHLTGALAQTGTIILPGILVVAIIGLLMYISYYVYNRNFFILTNESVIEKIQYGLLSHREQTINLGSVQDSSYNQAGVFQYAFNYGTISLSTVGGEDTYQFFFVRDPKAESTILSNAVENYKSNRPVDIAPEPAPIAK